MEEEIQLKLAEVMMDYYVDGNGQTLQDYIIDQCNKSEDGIFSVGDGMFSTVDGELSYTDSKGNTSIISIGNNGEVTIEGGISSDGSMNDNKAPSISATSTTNSITFVAKDILAGVAGWNYSTTNSEPTTWNEVLPAQKSFTHTINNLTNNTIYYIWAKDASGNISTAKEIKTKDFGEFDYEVSWNGANATITVNLPSTGVQFKTSPEGVWEDYSASNQPKAASGATVYFQVTDGTNVKAFASVKPLKTSTITYDANGGTGNVPNAQTATHMENITVENNNTLSKTGYHFLGWALTNNATSAITNFEMPAQDVTLYAVWQSWSLATSAITAINYGDNVNYTANGVNEWQVFFNDNNNVYLIAKDCVQGSSLNLGDSINVNGNFVSTPSGIAQHFINWLRDNRFWLGFVDSLYADYAIGAPNLKELAMSVNGKLGTNYTEVTIQNQFLDDPMYKIMKRWWIAEKYATDTQKAWYIIGDGHLYQTSVSEESEIGVRPVVCLSTDIKMNWNGTAWDLAE